VFVFCSIPNCLEVVNLNLKQFHSGDVAKYQSMLCVVLSQWPLFFQSRIIDEQLNPARINIAKATMPRLVAAIFSLAPRLPGRCFPHASNTIYLLSAPLIHAMYTAHDGQTTKSFDRFFQKNFQLIPPNHRACKERNPTASRAHCFFRFRLAGTVEQQGFPTESGWHPTMARSSRGSRARHDKGAHPRGWALSGVEATAGGHSGERRLEPIYSFLLLLRSP
jgi:hypothetical protein